MGAHQYGGRFYCMTQELFEAFIRFLIAKIAMKIPFLALPVINPIFGWIFSKVAMFLYEQLAVMVSYKIIDINIYRALVSYNESWQAIKKETDRSKIPELRLKYDEKLKALISFNSSFVRIDKD